MLFFLSDVLIIALFVAVRHSNPAASSPEPLRQTGNSATRRHEQAPLGTSRRHGDRSRPVPRALTGSDIPGWTALDDHQLIRLLKQSSA